MCLANIPFNPLKSLLQEISFLKKNELGTENIQIHSYC